MVAKFRVASTDPAIRGQATVLIDRETGLITVRPLRKRKTYTLPLGFVAALVVTRCVKAEVAQAKAERKKKGRAK